MRKYVFAIACMLSTMTGFAQDALIMQRSPLIAGQEGELSILLKNKGDQYIACQFDIDLPAGLSVKKEDSSYALGTSYTIPNRAVSFDKDGIAITEQGQNHYRVTMYNRENNEFKNQSGAILVLNVVASEDFSEQIGRIYDIVLTNVNRESYKPKNELEIIKGDANADLKVNVADADYVIEKIGDNYDKNADVNVDSAVDVADVDFVIEQIQ